MSTEIKRRNGGYFNVPNLWIDAGYMESAPGSVTQVYLHLSRWADNGTLQSSQPMRLIAKKCGLSEDVARKAVRVLEAWSVLDRDPDSGRNAKNIWMLNDLHGHAPEYPDKVPPKQSGGPDKVGAQQSGGPYQPNQYQPNSSEQPKENILPEPGKTPTKKTKSNLSPEQQEQFDRWYKKYPRKIAKHNAMLAWAKANPSDELVEIMISKIEAWAKSEDWHKDDGKFIPHPATWLNAHRWEDDDPAPAKRKQANWEGGQVYG